MVELELEGDTEKLQSNNTHSAIDDILFFHSEFISLQKSSGFRLFFDYPGHLLAGIVHGCFTCAASPLHYYPG